MSTPYCITFAAVVALALSVSACDREDKPASPKPKTDAGGGMARVGSLQPPRPAIPSAAAAQGTHSTGSASAK